MKRNLINANKFSLPGIRGLTTVAVAPSNTNGVIPEWGRWQDVQRLYAIKRGLAYTLLAEGKIKAVSVRRRGHVRGCRLFYLPSIAEYLNGLLENE